MDLLSEIKERTPQAYKMFYYWVKIRYSMTFDEVKKMEKSCLVGMLFGFIYEKQKGFECRSLVMGKVDIQESLIDSLHKLENKDYESTTDKFEAFTDNSTGSTGDRMYFMYKTGYTIEELSKEFKIPYDTVKILVERRDNK